MSNTTIGSTITISRTEEQESKIIDVSRWNIYRVINDVQEEEPTTSISVDNGITVTDPEDDEGAPIYSVSVNLAVGGDLSAGSTLKWMFVPAGTEADLAGTLDWETEEYDVTKQRLSTKTLNISNGIHF